MPLKKAFLFAAGLGTRLRPYTYRTPKPLLEVHGRPIIEYLLAYLARLGVEEVTVNTAHLAGQFEDLPALADRHGLRLDLSRQEERYEHGGDLAFARAFWTSLADDEAFLAVNADTIFYLEPERLHRFADEVTAQTPVLVVGYDSGKTPLMVHEGRVVGLAGRYFGARYEGLPYTGGDDFGIKILHRSLQQYLPETVGRFSFYEGDSVVRRLVADGKDVLYRPVDGFLRVEIGTVQDYEAHASDPELRQVRDRLF